MRKAISVIILCMLLLSLPTSLAGGYTDLTASEAKTMIDSTTSMVVLDVRTQDEYNSGHIRNAKNIPLPELEGRLGELSPLDEILVYCMLGGRSATAGQLLVDNGFMHVYNMLGGITAWTNAGYEVYVRYSSVQAAINETHVGETIFVSQGSYYEHLNITKPLTLVGENTETTIIDGEDSGTIVRVEADGVVVTGFTLRKCGCPCEGNSGVYVGAGHKNVEVTHNLITQNIGYGINVDSGSEVNLAGNTVTYSNYGVRLHNSTRNTVVDNVISNNTNMGIYVSFSNNSIFHGNEISGNTYAIGLFYSVNNTFYHNNILDNAVPIYPYDTSDNWDNGCEGNYWSGYDGQDLNGDGVGDTQIPWEDVDSYPLMTVYWNPGDVDHDLDVDIFDVVKTASAYASIPSDPNWNPHCDIAEPYGVISIFDIVLIAGNYGKEHNT